MTYLSDKFIDSVQKIEYEESKIIRKHFWDNGIHIDQHGKKWKLTEMKTSHLINTIKYFNEIGFNVGGLKKELKKRQLNNTI